MFKGLCALRPFSAPVKCQTIKADIKTCLYMISLTQSSRVSFQFPFNLESLSAVEIGYKNEIRHFGLE